MVETSQRSPYDGSSDVVIDYVFDASWNRGHRDFAAETEFELRNDCFLGDIVLRIGGDDFSARWGWVPVLDFAVALSVAIRELESKPESWVDFTENEAVLSLNRVDDWVVVSATYAAGNATAAWSLFLETSRLMNRKLTRELEQSYPALIANAAYTRLKNSLVL